MKLLIISSSIFFSTLAHSQQTITDPTKPSYITNQLSASITVKKDTAGSSSQQAQVWTLETTLADSKRIIAIINGQQVSVGDEVDGAYVMHINHQYVTLKQADTLFDIKLQQSFTTFMK
jgi:hypothetical protein